MPFPQIHINDCFVDTVAQHIIILLYKMVFVSCPYYLLPFSAPESNLSAVYRIVQYRPDQICIKHGIASVLPCNLLYALLHQMLGDTIGAQLGIYIFIINNSDSFCFSFFYFQLSIDQLIPIRDKTV